MAHRLLHLLGEQAIIAVMTTDISPPRQMQVKTLVQLERMKVWRQAFVAYTRNEEVTDRDDLSPSAKDWADGALTAFDKQFGTGE